MHSRLVAAGGNPLDPLVLVNAAARELDLELAWLKIRRPALKGARALFDEQSGTICCEDVGEAFQRALLVAHEIGHAAVQRHGHGISILRD